MKLWQLEQYRYELARRVSKRRLPAFDELDDDLQMHVLVAFQDGTDVPVMEATHWPGKGAAKPGWTLAMRFNLARPDRELRAAFEAELALAREQAGMPSPTSRGGATVRHRPPSEEWLRLLDSDGKNLDDADRSKRSVARREARKWLPSLRKVEKLVARSR